MRFGRWASLPEAKETAPATAGVFQVRIASGLVDYATGKSAMIHYAAAPNLRVGIGDFADAHSGADWLCRHCEDFPPDAGQTPEQFCQKLLQRFTQQFGNPPQLPPTG